MPFRSEKQRRLLWATNPEIAKRWAKEYPESNRDLPTYAKKEIKSKKPKATKSAKISYNPLQIALNSMKSPGNTQMSKAAESILSYIQTSSSDKPTFAGEQAPSPVTPACGPSAEKPKSILNSQHDKDPNEPPFEYKANGNKAAQVTEQEYAGDDAILGEIAPILKKMGEAWRTAEQRLCSSRGKGNLSPGLDIYAKAAAVVKLGPKVLQDMRRSQELEKLIPASHRNSPQFKTRGINLKQLGFNIKQLKQQRILAQNPLPLGVSGGSGAGSPQNSPVPSYPGMASSPTPPTPGSVNPMLAGSNSATSPIQHFSGIKTQDNQAVSGPQALLGKGNAGFTGAATLHGNEQLPNMTEFASNKLGIPRFA